MPAGPFTARREVSIFIACLKLIYSPELVFWLLYFRIFAYEGDIGYNRYLSRPELEEG